MLNCHNYYKKKHTTTFKTIKPLTVTLMGTVHSVSSFWTFLLALCAGVPGTAQTRPVHVRTLSIVFAFARTRAPFTVTQQRARSGTVFAVPARFAVAFTGPGVTTEK